jgi:hypothetical protein
MIYYVVSAILLCVPVFIALDKNNLLQALALYILIMIPVVIKMVMLNNEIPRGVDTIMSNIIWVVAIYLALKKKAS